MADIDRRLKSVFVVEEDPLLCLGLEKALRGAGAHRVFTANGAVDASGEFDGGGPDIIVLDLQLADSDEGFGIAENALQLFHSSPQILFSIGSPDRNPEHLAAIGRSFEKHYDPAELARQALGLI